MMILEIVYTIPSFFLADDWIETLRNEDCREMDSTYNFKVSVKEIDKTIPSNVACVAIKCDL